MMKNGYLSLITLVFIIIACNNVESQKDTDIIDFDSGFSLHQDTISINVKGEMTHALKYRDKYYVLFKQRVLKYGGYGKRWLYIFSNGQVERVIDCPKEMKTIYLDFYTKNDSIILKPYMDKQTYHFNTQDYTWNKIDDTDDLIFEDDNFYVYSLDFGEWGGKTWFRDKKTGNEYVLETTTPLVNKIGTTYYLSNSFQVLKIENPLELTKCDNDVTYENIQKSGKYYSWYSESIGYEILYIDNEVDFFDYSYKPHIVSSFVVNDELLYIYETDSATYLSRMKNNIIEPFEKIKKNIGFYNWHYSYRCKNLNGTNELLKFKTQEENVFGLMDIIDNELFITYFVNTAELYPRTIGAKKSNELLVNRLKVILTDFNELTLNAIELKEQNWRTFDVTPNHTIGIGDSWNPKNYVIDKNLSYNIVEDSIISNTIMYFATKETDLIRAITINWEPTNYSRFDLRKLTRETFITRYETLESILIQELGQPTTIENESENKYPKSIWKKSNGLTIELINAINLKTNYNNIRLVFYSS